MNEENIKKMESKLVLAYREGHYKEDLVKMIEQKPGLLHTFLSKGFLPRIHFFNKCI